VKSNVDARRELHCGALVLASAKVARVQIFNFLPEDEGSILPKTRQLAKHISCSSLDRQYRHS
jgi:hypothetical protein